MQLLQVELNSQNHTGATPFFAACTGGHAKIVKYLAGKRRGDDFAVDIEVDLPEEIANFCQIHAWSLGTL